MARRWYSGTAIVRWCDGTAVARRWGGGGAAEVRRRCGQIQLQLQLALRQDAGCTREVLREIGTFFFSQLHLLLGIVGDSESFYMR